MDPPYQGVRARDNRYAPKVSHDAFCDELAALNRRKIRYLVSYDGRTGDKVFGPALPGSLGLLRLEVHAGRFNEPPSWAAPNTFESLYVSAPLARVERTCLSRGAGTSSGKPIGVALLTN